MLNCLTFIVLFLALSSGKAAESSGTAIEDKVTCLKFPFTQCLGVNTVKTVQEALSGIYTMMVQNGGSKPSSNLCESRNCKAIEHYNVVIENIDDIAKVLDDGIDIKVNPVTQAKFKNWAEIDQNLFKGAVVVVRGLYDRGKTFFFHRLCNIPLPASDFLSTEALAIVVTGGEKSLTLVDTAGTSVPVPNLNFQSLVDARIGESLINDIAFSLGNYYVQVIGQLTSNDQEELLNLVQQMRTLNMMERNRVQKEFILVHNLRGIDLAHVPAYFTSRITKTFPDKLCIKFDVLTEDKNAGLKKISSEGICKLNDDYTYSFGQFYMTSVIDGITIYHFFLVDERNNKDAEFINDVALDNIRHMMNVKLDPKIFNTPVPIIAKTAEILSSRLPIYLMDKSYANSVDFDDQGPQAIDILISQGNETNAGGFKLTLGGELVVRQKLYDTFSIERLPPPTPNVPFTSYDRISTTDNSVMSTVYQLEIPGLTSASEVSVVRYNRESNWAVVKTKKKSVPLEFAKPTEVLIRVNNDIKVGDVSFLIPVRFPWGRNAITCVENGLLTVIFNDDLDDSMEKLQCPVNGYLGSEPKGDKQGVLETLQEWFRSMRGTVKSEADGRRLLKTPTHVTAMPPRVLQNKQKVNVDVTGEVKSDKQALDEAV